MTHWVSPYRPLAAEDQVRSEERNEDEMSKNITKRNKQGEISERGESMNGWRILDVGVLTRTCQKMELAAGTCVCSGSV
jgi:hypothetical protein